jgi:hypothetical protein
MPPVEQQDGQRDEQHKPTKGAGENRAPDILDRQFEQGQPEPGEHKSAQIEPRRRRGAEIVDQPECEDDAGDPDR